MKLRFIILISMFFLIIGGIVMGRMLTPLSDEDLSSHEIIVVAKWNPTSVTSHSRYEWNAELDGLECKEYEQFTTIEVIRTIKGELKPGNHIIRIPLYMVSFETIKKGKGPTLYWFGSTEQSGAVDDVTVPCLWFLNNTKSWIKGNETVYPTLTSLFGVQSLSKEKYFTELVKKEE